MKWNLSLPALILTGCEFFTAPTPKVAHHIVMTGAMEGALYAPAFRIVNRYCADCHTLGGKNDLQHDAWNFAVQFDTYSEWVEASKLLKIRLAPELAAAQDPPVAVMPNISFPFQPTQAERDTLLEWIKRGSPNTPSGE